MAQIKGQKCAYCLKKLCRFCILCSQCSELRLCIECFLAGAEGGKHKRNHGYTVERTDSAVQDSLFDPLWTSESVWHFEEELKLMDAVETYGYGNWNEVASCITNRTPLECKLHYERFYIAGTIGACTAGAALKLCYRVIDHTALEKPVKFSTERSVSPEDQSALGYMPLRDEFECEYMNNAEKLITTIPFGPISDDLQKELQLAMVDIYNRRLEARFLRHSVAREHGLVTHLMRDLRSGQEKHRKNQSSRRVRGSRRTPHRRWVVNRRRKPGRTHWSTLTVQQKEASTWSTAITTASSSFADFSLSKVTHPEEPITCDSTIQLGDYSDCEKAKTLYASPSYENSKPRSRSFENLCASGDDLSLVTTEKPVCSTCLFPTTITIGTHFSGRSRSKLSQCTGSSAFPCGPLPQCFNSSSRTSSISPDNTDSGVFSCDSCAQSTISTLSTGMDVIVSTSSVTLTPTSILKRPRSRSDSFDLASLPRFHSTKSTEFLASLLESRQLSELTEHNTAPLGVPNWVTNGHPKDKCPDPINEPVSEKSATSVALKDTNTEHHRSFPSSLSLPSNPTLSQTLLASYSKKNSYKSNFLIEYPWLKPFARFLDKSDANVLSQNLSREQQLRSEIQQLWSHHQRGIRCMKDICLQPSVRLIQAPGASTNGNFCIPRNQRGSAINASRRLVKKRARGVKGSRKTASAFRTARSKFVARSSKLNRRQTKNPILRVPKKSRVKQRRPGPGRPPTRI